MVSLQVVSVSNIGTKGEGNLIVPLLPKAQVIIFLKKGYLAFSLLPPAAWLGYQQYQDAGWQVVAIAFASGIAGAHVKIQGMDDEKSNTIVNWFIQE